MGPANDLLHPSAVIRAGHDDQARLGQRG
jgi:hypothetical protein